MKKLFFAMLVFSCMGVGYFVVKQYDGSALVVDGAERAAPTKSQEQEVISTANRPLTDATDRKLEASADATPNGVVVRLPDHKPVEIVSEKRDKIDEGTREKISDQSAESQHAIESLAQEYNENLSNEMERREIEKKMLEASKAYRDAAIKLVKAGR